MTDEEQNRQVAAKGLGHAQSLLNGSDFEWFMTECVDQRMSELDVQIKDPKTASADRDKAVERWNELKTLKAWLPERRAMYQRHLGHRVDPA